MDMDMIHHIPKQDTQRCIPKHLQNWACPAIAATMYVLVRSRVGRYPSPRQISTNPSLEKLTFGAPVNGYTWMNSDIYNVDM